MKRRTLLRTGVLAGAGAVLRPASGQTTPTAAASMPPGKDNLCQVDVLRWQADAMARGG